MDDVDRRVELALPLVADVFIDVTAHRSGAPRHPDGTVLEKDRTVASKETQNGGRK
jgi:hypothetical protein